MKRRKPFRSLAEIEAEIAHQREWRAHHEKRLVGCDDGTAVFHVVSHGVAREIRAGDPFYQRHVEDTISDVGGIVWLAEKNIKRLQKEHRKVSRFLARHEKGQISKNIKSVQNNR